MNSSKLIRRKKPPSGRTPAQVVNHYQVEKAIADRLKRADREERKIIYAGMYDELFARVPDHPRLTAVRDPDSLRRHNEKKLALVERFVNPAAVFVEFAPGDCTFAYLVCGRAGRVVGVDISDQSLPGSPVPPNFTLRVYDGFDPGLPENFADVVFSDQFVEHLHPDDADLHFRMVRTILKPGGSYILRTPHAFHGPFDVSAFFSRVPEGFHLKEWTFAGLRDTLRRSGYTSWRGGFRRRGRYRELPVGLFAAFEGIVRPLPHRARALVSRFLLPRHIYIRAVK
jgi:SAM-dependent methyltransferase